MTTREEALLHINDVIAFAEHRLASLGIEGTAIHDVVTEDIRIAREFLASPAYGTFTAQDGEVSIRRLADQDPLPGGTTAIRGGEYVREYPVVTTREETLRSPRTRHGRYVLTTSRLHNWPAFDVNDILLIEDEAATPVAPADDEYRSR